MEKKPVYINRDTLERLNIDPEVGIKYLENKKAIDLTPVHVKAFQILKQKPAVASS